MNVMQTHASQCKSMQANASQCKLMQTNANPCKSMQINANECKPIQANVVCVCRITRALAYRKVLMMYAYKN